MSQPLSELDLGCLLAYLANGRSSRESMSIAAAVVVVGNAQRHTCGAPMLESSALLVALESSSRALGGPRAGETIALALATLARIDPCEIVQGGDAVQSQRADDIARDAMIVLYRAALQPLACAVADMAVERASARVA